MHTPRPAQRPPSLSCSSTTKTRRANEKENEAKEQQLEGESNAIPTQQATATKIKPESTRPKHQTLGYLLKRPNYAATPNGPPFSTSTGYFYSPLRKKSRVAALGLPSFQEKHGTRNRDDTCMPPPPPPSPPPCRIPYSVIPADERQRREGYTAPGSAERGGRGENKAVPPLSSLPYGATPPSLLFFFLGFFSSHRCGWGALGYRDRIAGIQVHFARGACLCRCVGVSGVGCRVCAWDAEERR